MPVSLDHHNSNVGDKEIGYLAEAIENIVELNLEQNLIGAEAAGKLADAILQPHRTPLLMKLKLRCNHIGDIGTQYLAMMLLKNETIDTLELQWNHIGKKGAKALARALKGNKVLTDLNLYHNHIGDFGANFLAETLKYNRTLTALDLQWNYIGRDGAASIILMLNVNWVLKILKLKYNYLRDSTLKAISNIMQPKERPSTTSPQ